MLNYTTELYCFIDDFCKAIDQYQAQTILTHEKPKKPTRTPELSVSEIATIMLLFQKISFIDFKSFYNFCFKELKEYFPKLVSYNRFVELQQRCLSYLFLLFQWFCLQTKLSQCNFIDATKIAVCHNKRINSHKVFKGLVERGKSTMGWFFGFKLHLVISDNGEIQGAMLTPGNVDDRQPVEAITQRLTGLLFGDKGYISQKLFEELQKRDLKLITNVKKNMKEKFMTNQEKTLLKKRSIIETTFDLLKNKAKLVHTRHRSVQNFLVHVVSTLVSYCLKGKKPKIKFTNLIPN